MRARLFASAFASTNGWERPVAACTLTSRPSRDLQPVFVVDPLLPAEKAAASAAASLRRLPDRT